MMTPMRYILLVLGMIISLHYIMSFSHEGYGNMTSITRLTEKLAKPNAEPPYRTPVPEDYYKPTGSPSSPDRKANATFVMLVRNSDLTGIMSSMRQLEDRFNRKFNYPYVFLNEQPFSDDFKKHITALTDAPVEFGLIPAEDWYQPDWIDEDRATKAREDMVRENVIYGGSVPYRNMCRFNSGFFYKQELLQKYKYYWRVEPDVKFFCDLDYDPFLVMQDEKKVYGFTVSLFEYPTTIPTLWNSVKEFINSNPTLVSPDNAMAFLSDDGGESYNRCHFWSNFEIGDLDFWRDVPYSKFFDFLDEKGGFYYERWGDAPVHSIGAALFARKDQIHFFNDIGYRHEPFQHCPQGDANSRGRCWCDPTQNFDYEWYSCLNKYDKLFS
ncbi:glycosyltransferase family 15 protein [Serpula lacrymans var. lacrymans S7.3]|uniref:Glycosyltransferase family 15 protein n=2 Tax=Serpula lacrymans var. lacrymans TaxID=341189 RepID=F8Q5R9_SERL3|nr:glycosyltransferase family 15 protein [Serpula lacrymans var. lacrymans S7.9]EGN95957.1 glycosyltransferase family 15 protein [Serpula lacrymans var. lacrymans S7.3]EGO21480.1 glycosyltransferase family 15 protein [Serpula lacrymans var. lacrymans S7.9]